MKRLLFLTALLYSVMSLSAQQRPQYTQYLANSYLLNPAISGIENYTDVKIGYRQQWAGLQDAPKTSFISAHWALGDEYLWPNALSFEGAGNDPRSRSYTQNYTASPAHHGIGIIAVSDKAGQLSNIGFNVSYAYHLQLNYSLNLSFGVAGGFNRIGININALLLENPLDPALSNAANARLYPDLSIGTWLYGASFFTGLSVQQVLPQKMSFSADERYNTGKQVAHIFLNSGYKFYLSEDLNVTPSLLFKYVDNLPLSMDINAKMGFRDRMWLGAGYRKRDALIVMAGFNINHLLNFTYSYDFTASALNQVSRGSHEVVLGLLLNNVYKVACPQRLW
ncbi:type IX secretion system membrane protein PorP/SprF [Pedobacter chinensis]|uniref:Type IX secretion system membrane protein PorP/SprF n=1 Tax=Pedobacter chinensis TaxID=2282421 RepID=A0A369Q0N0_9SPHI|nr:type IX secretion system membrane protein PorP/SprF [Pedobacter chinensis]RDC58443.1 type IX secretion system membrane protein PorP/SprF [Pedobacter chinensis]